MHGWVAFVEECVVRSIDGGIRDRNALLDLLTAALFALVDIAPVRGAEVVEQQPSGNPGRCGEVLHRQLVDRARGEHLHAELNQLSAPVGANCVIR